MKALKASLLCCALLLGLTPATAADTPLIWPPQNGSNTKLLGMHIQDDFGFGMTNRLSKAIIPGPQPFCSSLDDPACAANNERWWVLRLLPPCEDTDANDDCVEGLEVTQGGETRKSQLMERIQERTWKADPARGLPQAGSQGLWSDPFSDDASKRYFVNVFGDMNAKDGKYPPFTLGNFFASVTPTSDSGSITGTCMWRVKTKCGRRINFEDDARISLILHLSPKLTGWLGGRLNEPSIKIEPINQYVNRLIVSGGAMKVNMVGASIPYSEAPADLVTFMRKSNPGCPSDRCDVGIASSGPHTFDYLEKWKVITKDTASITIPYWSISHSPSRPSAPQCVKEGFIGLVTTNATAYQQAMPELNGGELSYKVSGPHFMPDGTTLSKGNYNLLLRSDVARCAYEFSAAPIKASVSIVSEGDVQSIATEVVSEKDGWMYLAANGFHFSEPSIKVRLSQDTVAKAESGEPTISSPTVKAKKTSLICARGGIKKKVTAIKPTCPKGFKKVA